MSYILDALRKSEAERSRADGSKGTVFETTAPLPKRRSPLLWLIGILLILNVFLVGLFLGGGGREQLAPGGDGASSIGGEKGRGVSGGDLKAPSVSPSPDSAGAGREVLRGGTGTGKGPGPQAAGSVGSADESTGAGASIADLMTRYKGVEVAGDLDKVKAEGIEMRESARRSGKASIDSPPPPASLEDGPLSPQTGSTVVAELIREELAQRAADRGRATGESTAAQGPDVVPGASARPVDALSTGAFAPAENDPAPEPDLPPLLDSMAPGFRERLPELRINVYVYAEEPERRFVMINMRKYREGSRIGEELVLESIGKRAMILAFEGTRFRVSR